MELWLRSRKRRQLLDFHLEVEVADKLEDTRQTIFGNYLKFIEIFDCN